jgi:AcrR family transcriptional regulator
MTRTYELKRRAEQQVDTRQRIVEAAVELHQTLGPRATTVSDIARRAGVGRVTVYRHFSDELALAQACSGLFARRNPLPNPDGWRSIRNPIGRMRAGLRDAYAYHRATEAMSTRLLADGRDHELMAPYHACWRHATDVLVSGWRARGRRRQELRAAIGLALTFDTWRTLVREHGLTDEQAVELATRFVGCDESPKASDD